MIGDKKRMRIGRLRGTAPITNLWRLSNGYEYLKPSRLAVPILASQDA